MQFPQLSQNSLHHAYLLVDKEGLLYSELLTHCKGLAGAGALRVSEIRQQVFTIDDARKLKEHNSFVNDGKHIIFVAFEKIVEVAQQALLKTIEEPASGTTFILVVRSEALLLPTILSRVQRILVSASLSEKNGRIISPADYAIGSYTKRTELLAPLIESARAGDDVEKGDAKNELTLFLTSLEEYCAKKSSADTQRQEALVLIFSAKRDLLDLSPSVKMVFEHLSLRFPQFNIS